ncbi:glycosyltransferase family 2 protein [Haloarcula brevis]|uniref:glycosyltransferase family 2 protein n=1 Tax=Haloarcula brevis TaxID=3111453 RepID=UPI00300EF9AA
MSRTVVELDADSRLVTVAVATDGTEPLRVSFRQPVPPHHTLRVGDDGSVDAYADGTVTVTYTAEPGSDAEFCYRIDGPVDSALSEPTAEVLQAAESGPASPTVTWVDAEGTTTPLSMSADTVTARTDGALPMITGRTTPAADPLAGVAIGVILTPTNEDAVVRTVLRARRRGHAVLVTTQGVDGDAETLEILETLGAVVSAPPSKWASQLQLHRVLSQTARGQGLPGIVLQTRDCPRIDYERTATAATDADYEVIAIPELWNQSPTNPTVVVGIPAYNAADSIGSVVESALPYAQEVVVVDDGSHDGTADRARTAGATVVVHDRNRGYGGALKTIFREGAERDAAHLVVIDADGQHDPADIPALVQAQQRDETDIVIGSRYVGERDTKVPFVRSVGLAVINSLTNASLGKLRPSGFIHDTQSGYRAYSRMATRSLAADPMIGDNMGASTDILYHAHRNRLSVAEVGTTISYDVENGSSQDSFSHGMDLLRNIFWTVEYGRPLLILGLPGAVTTLVGVAVAMWLLSGYVETGTLATAPLAAAILFALGGLLLCVTSLMMHVLNGHPTLKRLRGEGNS